MGCASGTCGSSKSVKKTIVDVPVPKYKLHFIFNKYLVDLRMKNNNIRKISIKNSNKRKNKN